MPIYFVCLMGMGIVFVGLICIILICMAASAIIRAMESGSKTEAISQYAGAAARSSRLRAYPRKAPRDDCRGIRSPCRRARKRRICDKDHVIQENLNL